MMKFNSFSLKFEFDEKNSKSRSIITMNENIPFIMECLSILGFGNGTWRCAQTMISCEESQ